MYYYLYEIRNNINNKIYVGVHKTDTLDDGYMGSGKNINAAFAKYGLENFTKTILEYFNSSEEMFNKEAEIVNEEFLIREDIYNICLGGCGGWDYVNSLNRKEIRDYTNFGSMNSGSFKLNEQLRIRANMMSHSEESKNKRFNTAVNNKKSARFRCWVTNGSINQYLLKIEVEEFLENNSEFRYGKVQSKWKNNVPVTELV